MKTLSVALCGLLICGCSVFKRTPSIQAAGVTVQGQADAGKPATLEKTDNRTTITPPAPAVVTVTKFEPLPAIGNAPAIPAKTVTVWELPAKTEIVSSEATVKADTGTVDTSIAKARIEAEESRVLLYAALGAAALGALFVWLQYPTPAMVCGGAAVIFFLAWKVSGMPTWFWAVGLLGIGVAVALYFAHERGLKTKTP